MHPLAQQVRVYIDNQMVETSAAPSTGDTARALGRAEAEIEGVFRELDEARMLVLRPGSHTVWMAGPFSNMQTAFTVIAGGRAYYANCAWDAFGIPAMLGLDARIFTTCADCGGVLERKVTNAALPETRGIVHFALPPRRWWDNIGYT